MSFSNTLHIVIFLFIFTKLQKIIHRDTTRLRETVVQLHKLFLTILHIAFQSFQWSSSLTTNYSQRFSTSRFNRSSHSTTLRDVSFSRLSKRPQRLLINTLLFTYTLLYFDTLSESTNSREFHFIPIQNDQVPEVVADPTRSVSTNRTVDRSRGVTENEKRVGKKKKKEKFLFQDTKRRSRPPSFGPRFHGKLSFSRDERKRFIGSVRTRKVSQPINELLVPDERLRGEGWTRGLRRVDRLF